MIRIRQCREEDVDALYRICLETGDSGKGASALYEDPLLLGHVFAAPYAFLEPSLAFVAEDDEGVGGYIVGALHSQAFEDLLETDWWPKLREQYPDPPTDHELTRDEQWMAHFHHPVRSPAAVIEDYPSHLHINLLPRMQGEGAGGRLIQTFLDTLRHQGSPGVHLQVWARNERAVGFYRHLGFTEVSRSDDGLILGMRLAG